MSNGNPTAPEPGQPDSTPTTEAKAILQLGQNVGKLTQLLHQTNNALPTAELLNQMSTALGGLTDVLHRMEPLLEQFVNQQQGGGKPTGFPDEPNKRLSDAPLLRGGMRELLSSVQPDTLFIVFSMLGLLGLVVYVLLGG